MTAGLLRSIVEGYTAPRASVRRLLAGGHGVETALAMLALAYLVQAVLTILFVAGGVGFVGHVLAALQQVVMFFLLSALIHGLGRVAGGKGTMEGAQLVVGWHALVTSVISPLALGVSGALRAPAEGEAATMPAGVGVLAFVYVGISFWLMANYIAELHGFRSNWGVLGAIVGVTVACAIIFAAVVGAIAPA